MTQLRTKTIVINARELERVVIALAGTALVLAIAYGYFVTTTIFNMVHYRSATEAITRTSAEIGLLESNYLTLSRSLTLEKAYRIGLVEAAPAAYLALENDERSTALALEH